MHARTKTNLRILIIILNLICLPVNVHTMLRGLHHYHEHIDGAGGVIALGAIAFVWCLCAVILNTLVLLRSKSS